MNDCGAIISYFIFYFISLYDDSYIYGCALYMFKNIYTQWKNTFPNGMTPKIGSVNNEFVYGENAGEWRMSAPVNKLDKDQMEWAHNTNINQNN